MEEQPACLRPAAGRKNNRRQTPSFCLPIVCSQVSFHRLDCDCILPSVCNSSYSDTCIAGNLWQSSFATRARWSHLEVFIFHYSDLCAA